MTTATPIRQFFPALNQSVHGKRLAYLDNSATTQRPESVLQAMDRFYREHNANVHRGVHYLSQVATQEYDAARLSLARYLGVADSRQIIFTKGCTEAINLVAQSYGRGFGPGDRILVSEMEHHANLVPWQMTGATVEPIPILDDGSLDYSALEHLLDERVRMVCVTHVSNVLGTVNDVARVARLAHSVGAKVMADGAQALAHLRVNLTELDVDFYSMAAHKAYGPMGVGALYGRASLLEAMPPFLTGGSNIRTVSFEGTTFAEIPDKFEPGTPNVAGVVGLAAMVSFLADLNLDEVAREESRLASRFTSSILELGGVQVQGSAPGKAGVVSFTLDCAHPHDVGTIMDSEGVAVRAGHHCCQPLMRRFGIHASSRASLACYNTDEDVDQAVAAVKKVMEVFA